MEFHFFIYSCSMPYCGQSYRTAHHHPVVNNGLRRDWSYCGVVKKLNDTQWLTHRMTNANPDIKYLFVESEAGWSLGIGHYREVTDSADTTLSTPVYRNQDGSNTNWQTLLHSRAVSRGGGGSYPHTSQVTLVSVRPDSRLTSPRLHPY